MRTIAALAFYCSFPSDTLGEPIGFPLRPQGDVRLLIQPAAATGQIPRSVSSTMDVNDRAALAE